jgi:hypothetical protein
MTDFFRNILKRCLVAGIGLFRREIWTIGLIRQSLDDVIRHGLTAPVDWRAAERPGVFLADPHGHVIAEGERLILAERYDYLCAGHRQGKGEIVVARLAVGTSLDEADFQPAMEFPFHLSYPSLLKDSGCWYMFTESWEAHGIAIFSAPAPGGPWSFHELTLPAIPAVDATPVKWGDEWYLFCTRHDDGPQSRLQLFNAPSVFGPWSLHPCSPLKDDAGSARPAGPLFRGQDGQLYRPAQDCSATYGGAVVIHRVDELTPHSFRETAVRRIEPPRGRWAHGLHTVCAFGDDTLVDGKCWEWSLMEPLRRPLSQRRDKRRRQFADQPVSRRDAC